MLTAGGSSERLVAAPLRRGRGRCEAATVNLEFSKASRAMGLPLPPFEVPKLSFGSTVLPLPSLSACFAFSKGLPKLAWRCGVVGFISPLKGLSKIKGGESLRPVSIFILLNPLPSEEGTCAQVDRLAGLFISLPPVFCENKFVF